MSTMPELSPNDPPVAPRKRSNCCLGCSLAVVLLFALLGTGYWFFIYAPPLRISEETTRITGPLTPDGQIDFFKALEKLVYPKELATDENGYRLFVRAFGPLDLEQYGTPDKEFYESYRLQKYEKLGLDPNIPPSLTLPENPYEILKRHYKKPDEDTGPLVDKKLGSPWTLEELPMLADWVAQIDIPLDAIAEMVRRPVFCSPLLEDPRLIQAGKPDVLIMLPLCDAQYFRDLARLFRIRAMHRIATGNIDGAVDDTISLLEFGCKAGAQGTAIHLLVGVAIEDLALSTPLATNPEHQPDAGQMQRFLAAMDALPPRPPLSRYLEAERLTTLSAVQYILHNEEATAKQSFLKRIFFTIFAVDPNIPFEQVNEMCDAIIEKRFDDRIIEEDVSLSELDGIGNHLWRLGWTPQSRGKTLGKVLCSIFCIPADSFEKTLHREECNSRIKHLVFALLRYESEHGKLPEGDWPTAIRDYLGEDPDCYFSCPSIPAEPGKTTYALVHYEDGKRPEKLDTLLLVELKEPVPLAEATISAEEILQEAKLPESQRRIGSSHFNSMNVGYRNGAVEIFSSSSGWTDVQALREKLGLADPEE